jgi:hypothetical protein
MGIQWMVHWWVLVYRGKRIQKDFIEITKMQTERDKDCATFLFGFFSGFSMKKKICG